MEITIRVGEVEERLVQRLLTGSYREWNRGELLRVLAAVGLREVLEKRCEWQDRDEQAGERQFR